MISHVSAAVYQPNTIYRKYSYGFHFVILRSKNYLKNSCVLLPSITTLHLRTQEQVQLAGFVDPPSLVLTSRILSLLDSKYKITIWDYIQRQMFIESFLKIGQLFQ